MKKLLLTIGLAGFIILNTSAQTQPPNAGFENWESVGVGAEDPVDWSSFNEFIAMGIPEFLFKSTDANSGSFALRITSDTATIPPPFGTGVLDTSAGMVVVGVMDMDNPGIPYTDRPNEMKVFVKGTVGSGDACFVVAKLWKWNGSSRDLVGEAVYVMTTSIVSYTEQTIAFNYSLPDTPDTLSIMIAGGDVSPGGTIIPDNEFFVDDISFTGSVGINETGNNISINIYPNPVANELNIITSFSEKTVFEIYDVTGKQIESVEIEGKFSKVSTADIPAGTYIYQIVNKNSTVINKGKFNIVR